MQSAKIHLSAQQIKLVISAEWILTKNEILRQIKCALENLYTAQQSVTARHALPAEVLKTGGKISRGENYLGLPWLILDNPRCFIRGNIFAIRTMFWWGKFFSTTLHLSGKWQQHAGKNLLRSFGHLQKNNFRLNCNGDEWLHDVSSHHYMPVENIPQPEFENILHQAPFIKIAAYTDISQIDSAPEILMRQFELLVKSVS